MLAFKFIIMVFCLLLASCSSEEFKITEGGILYKFIVLNENNRQPSPGDIIEVTMYYKAPNDSILYDTREFGHVFRMKVKNPTTQGGTIDDAILMLHKGDSAIIKVDAVRFFTETKNEEVPSFIKPGDKLTFYIKVHNIYTLNEYLKQRNRQFNFSEEEEMKALDTFLKQSNITEQPTPSGLYFIEKQKGNGKFPTDTSTVVIHYLASFLGGEIFEDTYSTNNPFEFQLGKNLVIAGLEEGIKKMSEGGIAMLIIPSKLAYGPQQYKIIPPYTTLVFEVELVKVK